MTINRIGTNPTSRSTPKRDRNCAWVHAYLHRKEGDLSNARYWYRRSGKPESKLSLTEERQQIAQALLEQF
jgi:hypothetical protein